MPNQQLLPPEYFATNSHLFANSNKHLRARAVSIPILELIKQDINFAIHCALTGNVFEDPYYYNMLCSHLLETGVIVPDDRSRLLKIQAFCVGLLQNAAGITVCVRKFINSDPISAHREALDFFQPELNPTYYSRLCDLLSQDMTTTKLGSNAFRQSAQNRIERLANILTVEERRIYITLKYNRAYCLSLMNDPVSLRYSIQEALTLDPEILQQLIIETHRKHANNSLFCLVLNEYQLQIPVLDDSSTEAASSPVAASSPSSSNGETNSSRCFRHNPYSFHNSQTAVTDMVQSERANNNMSM